MNRESQEILESIRANLAKATTAVDVLYTLLAKEFYGYQRFVSW